MTKQGWWWALSGSILGGLLVLWRRSKAGQTDWAGDAFDPVDEAGLESFPASDPPQFGR